MMAACGSLSLTVMRCDALSTPRNDVLSLHGQLYLNAETVLICLRGGRR
jgi:hypothetical protein